MAKITLGLALKPKTYQILAGRWTPKSNEEVWNESVESAFAGIREQYQETPYSHSDCQKTAQIAIDQAKQALDILMNILEANPLTEAKFLDGADPSNVARFECPNRFVPVYYGGKVHGKLSDAEVWCAPDQAPWNAIASMDQAVADMAQTAQSEAEAFMEQYGDDAGNCPNQAEIDWFMTTFLDWMEASSRTDQSPAVNDRDIYGQLVAFGYMDQNTADDILNFSALVNAGDIERDAINWINGVLGEQCKECAQVSMDDFVVNQSEYDAEMDKMQREIKGKYRSVGMV